MISDEFANSSYDVGYISQCICRQRRCAYYIHQTSKPVSSIQLHQVARGLARSGGRPGGLNNFHRPSMTWAAVRCAPVLPFHFGMSVTPHKLARRHVGQSAHLAFGRPWVHFLCRVILKNFTNWCSHFPCSTLSTKKEMCEEQAVFVGCVVEQGTEPDASTSMRHKSDRTIVVQVIMDQPKA